MKTKNSYNTKHNTLWHNAGWKLVGRKDQNEQKFKKGGGNLVFVLLCFNYSTIYIYICMFVILPNVWFRCIYVFWRKSKHTYVCMQTHTISYIYMHVRLQSCIPINMETYPQKQLLHCLIFKFCTHACFFSG